MLAQCRTMIFLTTDTSVYSKVVDTLTSAVTTSDHDPRLPPVFSAITKEFGQTRKVIHCASTSRKRQIHVMSSKVEN